MTIDEIINKPNPSVKEMSFVVQNYIKAKRNVDVDINPRQSMLGYAMLAHAYGVAREYYETNT
jgi:hypothetical protein